MLFFACLFFLFFLFSLVREKKDSQFSPSLLGLLFFGAGAHILPAMNSHLSRSMQSMRGGIRVCMASTSKQGIATSSSCLSEDTPPTSMTSSMQQTQTQLTFPKIVGGGGAAAQGGGRRALRSPPALPPYPDWVQGQGKQYEEPPPGIGPFWIGATPFPLNPSFDPPPPISQSQKKVIWDLHRNDPNNTIRVLSGKYGISMERIQAILRLQALEAEWTEEVRI